MGTNKQLHTILDKCLESLLTGQETVEQCLQRYPEYANELEPMLRTAMIVNQAVDVKPSEDFRARARYQLQVMMAESKVPKRKIAYVPRWAIAVCAVLLVFMLGGGTILAADGTMPGNPLYAVKLFAENVRINLAASEEKKLELYAAVADRRVTEMAWMVDNNKTGNLEASAVRLNDYYAKISDFPSAESLDTNTLAATKSESAPVLAVPPQSTSDTLSAIRTPTTLAEGGATEKGVQQPEDSTTQTLPAPVITVVSNAELRNTLQYYAMTQPEKLQKLLDSDKVPEAVKPALQRALWAAEHSYLQAIYNLENY